MHSSSRRSGSLLTCSVNEVGFNFYPFDTACTHISLQRGEEWYQENAEGYRPGGRSNSFMDRMEDAEIPYLEDERFKTINE